MKQKIILTLAFLSIFLTGCQVKEESTYSYDGKIALENHQYQEAKKLLSSALEEDSSDEHSRAMYMQAVRMINVETYENIKNYEKAIKELEFIEEIKGGSSTIKSEATNKKKELEDLHEELKSSEQKRKDDAKYAAKQDKYRLEKEALELEKKKQEALQREQKEQEEKDKLQQQENEDKDKLDGIITTPDSTNTSE